MEQGFPWQKVIGLLSQNKTICRGILGPVVGTQGSGPYEEAEFDDFLMECGIDVRLVIGDEPPPVVVFGRELWSEDDVDELWEQTGGENIRVFSQELVVASMALGASIFDHYGSDATDLIDGHPALERFFYTVAQPESVYFPDTEIRPEPYAGRRLLVSFDTGEWPASGVLKEMGYRVGRSGLAESARRRVLVEVLAVELMPASEGAQAYVDEWGPPNTVQRLQKMVNSISAFARNARRRSADFSEAIADWESDLAWLRASYR